MVPFMFTAWLQKVFGVPLVVQLTGAFAGSSTHVGEAVGIHALKL